MGIGTYPRYDKRQTTDSCVSFDAKRVAFDVRQLFGDRTYFEEWTYRRGNRFYTVEFRRLEESDGVLWVELETTVNGCRFGLDRFRMEAEITPLDGLRWWWICPDCGVRRKFLYFPEDVLRPSCRVCLGLVHPVTQDNKRDVLLRRLNAHYRAKARRNEREQWRLYKRRARTGR